MQKGVDYKELFYYEFTGIQSEHKAIELMNEKAKKENLSIVYYFTKRLNLNSEVYFLKAYLT